MRLYLASADGDDDIAEAISQELQRAGNRVDYSGTVHVGDSRVAQAMNALQSGVPIILCATRRAAGSQWVNRLVNAANGDGPPRLFALKVEADVYLQNLTFGERAANWSDSPEQAVNELMAALIDRYPESPAVSEGRGRADLDVSVLDRRVATPNFDHDLIEQFKGSIREEHSYLRSSNFTMMEIFGRLLLLSPEGAPTKSAALLFGSNPQVELPSAVTQCAEYIGQDKAIPNRSSSILMGSARSQIDEAFDFVRVRVNRREVLSPNQVAAQVDYSYPMTCLREVIVNAVVHRSYEENHLRVHVRIYSDRIEVSSPGEWPGFELHDTSVALSALAGESIPRNPALAHAMSLIRYFEGEGSGVQTAVRDSRLNGAPEPTVLQSQGFVAVTIWPSRYSLELVDRILGTVRDEAHRPVASLSGLRLGTATTARFPIHLTRSGRTGRLDPFKVDFPADPERRTLILGEAGSGKSELLRSLAGLLADRQRRFPVLLRLRTAPQQGFVGLQSFLEWIESDWRQRGIDCPAGTADSIFESLPTLIIMDGLDELPFQSWASSVSNLIEELSDAYPKTSFVASSRPVGISSFLDQREWAVYNMVGWGPAEFEEFITATTAESGSAQLAKELLNEVAALPHLATATTNPMMATMLLELFIASGTLGRSQYDLLARMFDLFDQRWDTARGIGSSDLSSSVYETWLRQLALASFKDDSKYRFDEEWVRGVIDESYLDASGSVQLFLDRYAQRGTVLAEMGIGARGQRLYGFTHRMFQEFLAAEQVARVAISEKDFLNEVAGVLLGPSGAYVCTLFIQAWRRAHKISKLFASRIFQVVAKSNATSEEKVLCVSGLLSEFRPGEIAALEAWVEKSLDDGYLELLHRSQRLMEPEG